MVSGSTASPSTRVIIQPLVRYPGQRRAQRPGSSSSPSCLVYPSSPTEISKTGLARPEATLLLPQASCRGWNGVRFPWAALAAPTRIPRGRCNKWVWYLSCRKEGSITVNAPPAQSSRQALAARASPRLCFKIWDTRRRRQLN